MIEQKNLGILGVEVVITPDDDYEYLLCKNIISNGWFYLRRYNGVVNFYDVTAGEWNSWELKFSKIKKKEEMEIMIITRKTTITLPSLKHAHGVLKQGEN